MQSRAGIEPEIEQKAIGRCHAHVVRVEILSGCMDEENKQGEGWQQNLGDTNS